MKSYSYAPPRGNGSAKITVFCTLAGAAALLILGEMIASAKPFLQIAGFAAALLSVMLWSRWLLSGYVYTIELSADGCEADLIITEERGKNTRTVCRVCASGGRLLRRDPKSGRVFDYRPTPFDGGSYFYEVPERDGGGTVRFSPDEKMTEIMRALGCEVEE